MDHVGDEDLVEQTVAEPAAPAHLHTGVHRGDWQVPKHDGIFGRFTCYKLCHLLLLLEGHTEQVSGGHLGGGEEEDEVVKLGS